MNIEQFSFRVWDSKNNHMSYQSASRSDDFWYPFGFQIKKGGTSHLELMQWVQKDDKKGRHIFVGDILKIRVLRHEGDGSCPNIHHGAYYLYATVTDLRGSLKYNREAEEALSQPMGKEQFRQSVSYDYRLFGDLYWCSHFKKDANGEYVKDEEDKYRNWKRFYDYEVVGNVKETPELMQNIDIMKVPKSELVFV